ncbi:MAG: GT-D fold domain-containing glycosyltransferase [Chthoniobacter sp.]|nr:GT-D fold domain-containing glycosyltransferase [Chthoniobacter sp.]
MALREMLQNYGTRALAALRIPGADLRVIGERETLEVIRERRASMARYGDGELEIMIGGGIYFQEQDPELARRLRRILRAPRRDFLVGIPNFEALQIKTQSRKGTWQRYRRMFSHLVRGGAEYHSAFVSRPASIVGLESAEYFQAWQALWAGREVVVVHHSPATAEHTMFRTASAVHQVFCPAQNAFGEYAAVLERAAVHAARPGVLFLIAAGPTAGVLAWDLAERGAQALDIGHLTAACDEFTAKH